MKARSVPPSEVSSRTLRAEDYVKLPVLVTVEETVETDYLVHLDRVESEDQALATLDEMPESELLALIDKGKQVDARVTDRQVVALEALDVEKAQALVWGA
jgi:hypothetical protein